MGRPRQVCGWQTHLQGDFANAGRGEIRTRSSRAPGGPQVHGNAIKRPHVPLNTLYGSGVPRGDPPAARIAQALRRNELSALSIAARLRRGVPSKVISE
jgi:hypothetical protein